MTFDPAPDTNPKTQYGMKKPSLRAIPPVALLDMGAGMADGARKYGLMNWREHAVSSSVYYDAALRHFLKWWDGEDIDPDSGVHHLGHVMACCAIIRDAEASDKLNDDRPGIKGMFAKMVARLTKPDSPPKADRDKFGAGLPDGVVGYHLGFGPGVSVRLREQIERLKQDGRTQVTFGFPMPVAPSAQDDDVLDELAGDPGEELDDEVPEFPRETTTLTHYSPGPDGGIEKQEVEVEDPSSWRHPDEEFSEEIEEIIADHRDAATPPSQRIMDAVPFKMGHSPADGVQRATRFATASFEQSAFLDAAMSHLGYSSPYTMPAVKRDLLVYYLDVYEHAGWRKTPNFHEMDEHIGNLVGGEQ